MAIRWHRDFEDPKTYHYDETTQEGICHAGGRGLMVGEFAKNRLNGQRKWYERRGIPKASVMDSESLGGGQRFRKQVLTQPGYFRAVSCAKFTFWFHPCYWLETEMKPVGQLLTEVFSSPSV
jgi:hypothetical protein